MNLNNYYKESFKNKIGGYFSKTTGHSQPFLHWHPHYELLVILRGSYMLTSNTTKYVSDKPTVVIHRPYGLHMLNAAKSDEYARYVIHIDKKTIAQFPQSLLDMSVFANSNYLRADPNPQELCEFAELCDRLLKCAPDEVQGALYTALIFRKIGLIYASGRGEACVTKYSYVQDVLQLITDNLTEPLTIPALCKKFGVGHSKLMSDFKNATGSTYKKYLTDLRQTRARELLASGSSIISTSLEVGYSSEAHFITAFKKYWGITPGAYLRSCGC